MPDKTVLFGLDGATFDVLDDLTRNGTMPHLSRFIASGVRATLVSTKNPMTANAWPSMITGVMPGRHGAFDFIHTTETDGRVFFKLTDSRDIGCDTIWTMLSDQGYMVASLNFPLSFPVRCPAKSISRIIAVPGFVSSRNLKHAVYPGPFFDELRQLPGFSAKTLAWDLDNEKKAIQTMAPEEYESWIELHLKRQQQWAVVLKYVLTRYDCQLTGFIDDGPDKLQHLAWRFLDPACLSRRPTRWERHIRDLCIRYFRGIDDLLGEIVKLVGGDGRIFITSDHGFCATQQIFYVNVWLAQKGYLHWRDQECLDDSEDIAAARMKTLYEMLDWNRTTAFSPTPSCRGIYIRRSALRTEANQVGDYDTFRERLIFELLRFTDPKSQQPIFDWVKKREEVFPGSYVRRAPDVVFQLRDHGFPSVLNASSPLRQRSKIAGTHHPNGIFVAGGKGIRAGVVLDPLSIPDVCPALLYSVGAEIPVGLDGRLPYHVFEKPFVERNPSKWRARAQAIEPDGRPSTTAAQQAEVDEDLLLQLTQLGYVE